jgi:hypothetical protein
MKGRRTFDAVRWMRERRTQIDEEDRGLTWEEKRRKTHEIVSRGPLLAPFCGGVLAPDQLIRATVHEPTEAYDANGNASGTRADQSE